MLGIKAYILRSLPQRYLAARSSFSTVISSILDTFDFDVPFWNLNQRQSSGICLLTLLFSVVSGLRVPVEDTDSPQAGTVHSIGQIASKKAFLLFEYESFSSSQKHCFLTGAKRKMLQ